MSRDPRGMGAPRGANGGLQPPAVPPPPAAHTGRTARILLSTLVLLIGFSHWSMAQMDRYGSPAGMRLAALAARVLRMRHSCCLAPLAARSEAWAGRATPPTRSLSLSTLIACWMVRRLIGQPRNTG